MAECVFVLYTHDCEAHQELGLGATAGHHQRRSSLVPIAVERIKLLAT